MVLAVMYADESQRDLKSAGVICIYYNTGIHVEGYSHCRGDSLLALKFRPLFGSSNAMIMTYFSK